MRSMDTRRLLLSFVGALALGVSCTSGDEPAVTGATPRTPAPNASVAISGAPSSCSSDPVPQKRPNVDAVAFPRGDGPVFVGLGSRDLVRYKEDTRKNDGWYYYKTLWAISPDYGGTVTITGHRLDGSNEVRFNAGSGIPGEARSELTFKDGGGSWRYGPSDTLLRADGCYAFRIEGERFVDWVTFVARS